MKKNKILKIIVYIFALIGVICTAYFAFNFVKGKIEENKKNNNEDEPLASIYENRDYSNYSKITCDILNEKNDYYIYNDIIYSNGKLYEINIEKLFSNNQNCKEVENINYDKIIYESGIPYLVIDNQIYTYRGNEIGYLKPLEEIGNYLDEAIISKMMQDDSIIGIYKKDSSTGGYTEGVDMPISYYALKNDGNVYLYENTYKVTWNGNSNYEVTVDTNPTIAYDSKDYGKIYEFYYSPSYEDVGEAEKIEIYSDKGFYELIDIKTEECEKYADVECERKIQLDEEYKKYKDDILYINQDTVIDKKLNYYNMNIFTQKFNEVYPIEED